MSYTVYAHVAPNGKRYIGITSVKPEQRWGNGLSYSSNAHFTNAIKKYGWNNFEHLILEKGLTQDEACKRERELIAFYDSANPKKGYNKDLGGFKQGKTSPATLKKLRANGKRLFAEHPEIEEAMRKGHDEYFARPEIKEKISRETKERMKDPEVKARNTAGKVRYYQEHPEARVAVGRERAKYFSDPINRERARKRTKDYFASHPEARKRISEKNKSRWTEEIRQKFSETQKRVKGTPEARKRARDSHKSQMTPVEQLSLDGEAVARFECIGDAVRETGICRQNIMSVLKHKKTKAGNERQTAGGYKWRYLDER